jgi:hypothetical protein
MCDFSNLINELYLNKEWRINELKKIGKEIETNIITPDLKSLFFRSLIPMIYAHWEGFIVSSIKKYFECLNSFNFFIKEMDIHYITTAFEEKLENIIKSQKFDKRKKHLKILLGILNNKIKFNTKKIDTKSNLNFDVLIMICEKLKFNKQKFNDYKSDLNELVNIRNGIAHGDTPAFEFERFSDIEKYIDLIDNLMLDFISEIEDIIKNNKFKKVKND